MSKEEKILSYWSVRRRVRASVSSQLTDIETAISSTEQEEYDISESENLSFHQPPSTSNHDNVNFENPDMPSSVCEDLELQEDIDMAGNNDHDDQEDIEQYFHQQDCETDSDSSDLEPDSVDESFVDLLPGKLKDWAVKYQISNISLSELLAILKPICPILPKDPRTLLKTFTRYDILEICGGQYYHFGIEAGIKAKIKNCLEILVNDYCFGLQINIDGLPLFKSTSHQFWPILGRLENVPNQEPFIIGLFSGKCKPADLNSYLQRFVEEYCELQINGFNYDNLTLKVKITSVICDTPARAFVKNTKLYSGYHGCDKCTQNGVWARKMTYPETNAPLRTDASFNEMADEEHHKGPTPFCQINLGMVSQFPIDYMHLVCLGVMKRLILLWMKGPLICRLGSRVITEISDHLLSLKDNIPCEFSRKPRSLAEIDRWKATEFRQFLLYTGPVVLLKTIHDNMYDNFVVLSAALHILLNASLCQTYSEYAHSLLVAFVTHFCQMYGNDMAVYNVHGLVHLANDALHFGGLDNISSFPFENFLQKLKRLVRKPSFPLEQVIRRLSEQTDSEVSESFPVLKKEHNRGPLHSSLPAGSCIQFRSVQTEKFCLKLNSKDSCVRISDAVGLVQNIVTYESEIYIVYYSFRRSSSFFETPLSSSLLGIHRVSALGTNLQVAKLCEIQSKYAVVEFLKEQEVDVVASNWLHDKKTKTYWPKWKSTTKVQNAVRSRSSPTFDDFSVHMVRVLYESDSYEKARSKLKQAEVTSDIQTEAEDDIGQTKRKKIPNRRFDFSEFEEEAPLRPKSHVSSKKSSQLRDIPDSDDEETQRIENIVRRKSPRKSASAGQFPPVPRLPSPIPNRGASPTTPKTTNTTPSLFGNVAKPKVSAIDTKVLTLLTELKAQVKVNTQYLQAINKKLESVDGAGVGGGDTDLPENISLPLMSTQEVLSLDEQLKDTTVFKQMVNHLSLQGGDSLKGCVRRMLAYLIHKDAALKINWLGRNNKMGFQDLVMCKMIKKAVRCNRDYRSSTDQSIEDLIKDWFRYAKDLDGGRKGRNSRK